MQPWNNPENFPYPTIATEYSFRKGKHDYSATRNTLKDNIRMDDSGGIQLVWTPESPRLVPPEEVDFLVEDVAVRNREYLKARLGSVWGWGLYLVLSFLVRSVASKSISSLATLLIFLVLIPALNIGMDWLVLRRADARHLRAQALNVHYHYWLQQQPRTYVTYAIVILITVVGLAQLSYGLTQSILSAGLVKDAVRAGEWWRLLTAAFLHASLLHFSFNQLALLSLGAEIERLTHGAYVVAVFLVSAAAGNIFSLVLTPIGVSVGASGGIMGLLGYLLIRSWNSRAALPPGYVTSIVRALLWVALTGILAFNVIDNAAHLGGFVTGILLGLVMVYVNPRLVGTDTPSTPKNA